MDIRNNISKYCLLGNYFPDTLIAVIFAIIFSKPKKRVEIDVKKYP